MEEDRVATPREVDAALSAQRPARVAFLKRQAERRNFWPEVVTGLALLCYGAAYYVDRHASALLGVFIVVPVYVMLRAARNAKRREAARELEGERSLQLPLSPRNSRTRVR